MGETAAARPQLEECLSLYDPQQHRAYAFLYGSDPGVFSLSWVAHALWHLGFPDQALTRSHEALALAQELSHPFSLALALDYAAMVHQFRRERHAVQARVEAALALCMEQGFAYYAAWATIMQGWALREQGRETEGMMQMRQGLAALQATGGEVRYPYYLALLAEACGRARQVGEGLTVLSEALAAVHDTGECWWEAELYRLKGELLRGSTEHDTDAKSCFHQALNIARRQQAKSLELRAAMSLSRLWQQQGQRAEARALLAPIYGWFTEGFDTADLQEAKTLLEALA